MRFFFGLSFTISFLILFSGTSAYAESVLVITDQKYPIQNLPTDTRVIELDAAESLLKQSFTDLPANPVQAQKIARARLQNTEENFQNDLRTALQGIVDAWSLGITKIPAVIVDKRYVIYGQRDVGKALSQIQAYRDGEERYQGRAQP